MSWTEVFPYLDDEAIDIFENTATPEEKADLDFYFEVDEVLNEQPAYHVVVTSLFLKPSSSTDQELLPLIQGALNLGQKRPEVTFRVYLANDLNFLIPDLIDAGCEVHLMASPAPRHSPGALWRFLALENDGLITMTDSNSAQDVLRDVQRTEQLTETGLSHWRVAYTWGDEETEQRVPTHYRPILACHFGSAISYPAEKLMSAFIWHNQHGSIRNFLNLSDGNQLPIFGAQFPNYGFDEWFLLAALYPRMAFNGILSFIPWRDSSLNQWFALDIEYCTWANPKSKIIYHGDSDILKPRPGLGVFATKY